MDLLGPSLPILLILSSTLALLSALVSRYRRLRHIPGPILAATTDFWAATKIWRGEYYHEFIYGLHRKYGPVVRWGPNRVSFAQPAAIPTIYGMQNVFPKAPSYNPLVVLAKGEEIPTLITVRDETRISGMKRQVSAGFSQRTWLKQEGHIDSTIDSFLSRLKADAAEEVQLDQWLRFWAFDTITLLAFSESRQYLAYGTDIDGIFPAGKARFSHWRLWSALPSLEKLIFKNRLIQYFQRSTGALAQLAMRQIQIRQAGEKQAPGHDLMGRYLAASQQAPDVIAKRDVLALTISTIHAGSETVATTCALIMSYVLTNPEVYTRLEDEITQANLRMPAGFNDAEKLPFLDAVIRESQRLAMNPNCTERTVQPDGISICDTWIPAGTDVSISELMAARDPEVYGDNPNSFIPQRWLDADEQKFREMERASFHFSFGRRECMGRHLAKNEMKKMIASLIATFKITLTEKPQWGFDQNVGYTNVKVRVETRVRYGRT